MTAKETYEALSRAREPFLKRGRSCSKLTIPFLLPEEGEDGHTDFETPNQSFGSRAVNNLAAKLLTALFPSSHLFFRYTADETAVQEAEQDNPDIRTEIEVGLKQREKITMHELEKTPFRNPFSLALKYMVVTGNALLYLAEDNDIRVFRLDSYVVRRSPSGSVLEMVVQEKVNPIVLDEEVRNAVGLVKEPGGKDLPETVELYTHIKRVDKKWEVHQEINEVVIESSKGSYPLNKSPWLPLRFSRIDGEHYGRGFVEEFYGDFVSLEGFRTNLTEGAAALSKILFLVRPNGQTRLKDVATSKNGDIKVGSADDISVMQAEKRADFQVIRDTYRDIEAELAKSFLLNASIQRDAERVTAAEIRLVARELEDTLGGVYTILSQEFQLPFINIFTGRLERQGKLQKLPADSVVPSIVTGLSALGRTDDLDRLMQFVEAVNAVPKAPEKINPDTFITRVATALFIDQDGLILGKEEIAADQQQQVVTQAAPQVAQEITKGMMNNVPQEQTS